MAKTKGYKMAQERMTVINGVLYRSDIFGDVYVMTEFNSWMKVSQ